MRQSPRIPNKRDKEMRSSFKKVRIIEDWPRRSTIQVTKGFCKKEHKKSRRENQRKNFNNKDPSCPTERATKYLLQE